MALMKLFTTNQALSTLNTGKILANYSLNNSRFSPHKSSHVNFPDTVGLFKTQDVDKPF